MKLFHIASFTGNIGDKCSHNRFHKVLVILILRLMNLRNWRSETFIILVSTL